MRSNRPCQFPQTNHFPTLPIRSVCFLFCANKRRILSKQCSLHFSSSNTHTHTPFSAFSSVFGLAPSVHLGFLPFPLLQPCRIGRLFNLFHTPGRRNFMPAFLSFLQFDFEGGYASSVVRIKHCFIRKKPQSSSFPVLLAPDPSRPYLSIHLPTTHILSFYLPSSPTSPQSGPHHVPPLVYFVFFFLSGRVRIGFCTGKRIYIASIVKRGIDRTIISKARNGQSQPAESRPSCETIAKKLWE